MPKEKYMCQLCANHGIYNQPKKGHKQRCPHRNCSCRLCSLNTRRRTLDQMERKLRQVTGGDDADVTKKKKNSSSAAVAPEEQPPLISPTDDIQFPEMVVVGISHQAVNTFNHCRRRCPSPPPLAPASKVPTSVSSGWRRSSIYSSNHNKYISNGTTTTSSLKPNANCFHSIELLLSLKN